jgi:2,3-bisphosphoglycerate-dependent phosphoglycerate mutase
MREIQPLVLAGRTVIVVAHGNSLRALIMAIEGLSPEQILSRELPTGVPIVYSLAADSRIAAKQVLED